MRSLALACCKMIAVNRFPFIMVREKQCLETYLHVISVSMIHLTYNTTALHSYKDNFAFMGAIGNPTQSPKQIAIYRKIISTYCVVCFAAYCMMRLDNVHRFFLFVPVLLSHSLKPPMTYPLPHCLHTKVSRRIP